jgi:excisionase family DNA binding protein
MKGAQKAQETGMLDGLLTAEELAERLAVSPFTIVKWAKERRIPEIRPSPRIRRFDYNDVVQALKGRPNGERVPDASLLGPYRPLEGGDQ